MLQRRVLFKQGAVFFAGALCGACKKGEITCSPVTLGASDRQQRTALKYVDKSLAFDRLCISCQQYVVDPGGGCGTCKLLQGPINPGGTCLAFTSRG